MSRTAEVRKAALQEDAIGKRCHDCGKNARTLSSLPGGTVRMKKIPRLSDREAQVLELVAKGMTNKQIAAAIFIRPETVKTHVSRIFKKLKVKSRMQAVLRATELGFLKKMNVTRHPLSLLSSSSIVAINMEAHTCLREMTPSHSGESDCSRISWTSIGS